jgi:transcriptional regulator with XRE-family HTH domain
MASDENRELPFTLAKRLQAVATSRGLSVEGLAVRSGLDRHEVQRVLSGHDAGITVLIRLAGALEIDPAQLLEGIDWIPGEGGRGRFTTGDAGEG